MIERHSLINGVSGITMLARKSDVRTFVSTTCRLIWFESKLMMIEAKRQEGADAAKRFPGFSSGITSALATACTQLDDPFLRGDEHSALFGDEDWYFALTLSEIQWLNHP